MSNSSGSRRPTAQARKTASQTRLGALQSRNAPSELEATSRMTANGLVESVDGDWAEVLTQRQTGCSGCGSQKGCGTASLAKLFVPRQPGRLRVRNAISARPGDTVRLSMDESQFIQHSLMAYGIPLLGLFVGGLCVSWMPQAWEETAVSEWMTILGGLLGMIVGWLGVRRFYHPEPPLMEAVITVSEMEQSLDRTSDQSSIS